MPTVEGLISYSFHGPEHVNSSTNSAQMKLIGLATIQSSWSSL